MGWGSVGYWPQSLTFVLAGAHQAAGLVARVAAALHHVPAGGERGDGHLGDGAVGLPLRHHSHDHLQTDGREFHHTQGAGRRT